MMRRWIAAAAVLLGLVWAVPALAVCTLPYQLQNGKISDANQVMANFNSILSCVNSPSLAVTDGSTTVPAVTEIDLTSGAVVTSGGAGVADVAISGGGSCPAGTSGKLQYTTGSACAGDVVTTDGSGDWTSLVSITWAGGRFDDPGDIEFARGGNWNCDTASSGGACDLIGGSIGLTTDGYGSGLIDLAASNEIILEESSSASQITMLSGGITLAGTSLTLSTSSLMINTSPGLTCSGTPTSSFATVDGLVTHC